MSSSLTKPSDSGWALVTGASSGIGAALARDLRKRDQRVVIVARRTDRLEALAAELGGEEWVLPLGADLAQAGEIARLCDELERRKLLIDLLVNNAGSGDTGTFHEAPLDRITNMIDLNCRAVAELTRRLLPPMVERGEGAIVNVVSTGAFQPVPYLAVYAATKSFVLSFTEALDSELAGTGVRVQALCPGFTETEFFDVARTGATMRVNRMPREKPEAVALACLRGLDANRLRVFPRFSDRLVAGLVKFLPGRLVRWTAGNLYRESRSLPFRETNW